MPNTSSTGRDPYLEYALELLSKLDGEVNVILTALGAAFEVCMPANRLRMCAFDYDGGVYGAMVTVAQRQTIMTAVEANGNIFDTVASLINEVNLELFNSYKGLTTPPSKVSIMAPAPPVLGCCVCSSGKIPNLTQAQCNHFNPTSWGDPADCSGEGP